MNHHNMFLILSIGIALFQTVIAELKPSDETSKHRQNQDLGFYTHPHFYTRTIAILTVHGNRSFKISVEWKKTLQTLVAILTVLMCIKKHATASL